MPVRFDRSRVLRPDLPPAILERRALALDLAEAAFAAIEPEAATRAAIARLDVDVATAFAFGKASVPMARGAVSSLDVRAGALVALEAARVPPLVYLPGAHPDPSPEAEETARHVCRLADALGADDTALCLVSGGGSSMLELPAEGISLDTLRHVTLRLREAGADIAELNAVRRRCSALKGGGLARRIAPARVVNVVLSDVPGRDLALVASGPTCAPPSGPRAEAVIARYALDLALPPPPEGGLPSIETHLAADNGTACEAVVRAGRSRGVFVRRDMTLLDGEASRQGATLERSQRAWVRGGETVVRVRGDGRGGRSQELALGALVSGWSGGLLLAFGTDGVDGRSPASGALVDDAVVQDGLRLGLDPVAALANNDSFPFFDAAGASLVCGPTGTNVADLALYLP